MIHMSNIYIKMLIIDDYGEIYGTQVKKLSKESEIKDNFLIDASIFSKYNYSIEYYLSDENEYLAGRDGLDIRDCDSRKQIYPVCTSYETFYKTKFAW